MGRPSQIVPKPVVLSDRDFRRRRRQRRSAGRRRRRLIRRVVIGILIAIPVVGILTVLAVLPAAGAREYLQRGRDSLAKARSALLKGDLEQAIAGFTAAEGEFRQAKASGDNPLMRIPALFPLIGRTPDAIRTISDVGVRLSDAGGEITRAIGDAGGIDALAPKDGRIPVETLQGLAPAMSRARAAFEQAQAESEGIATTLVPQQVVDWGRDLVRGARRRHHLRGPLPEGIGRAGLGRHRRLPVEAGDPAVVPYSHSMVPGGLLVMS